ncbi:MAG: hypothetical protein Q8936_23320 [Bacillota bacterium]|nr:hypothetical protein [Bacillota bacterium]
MERKYLIICLRHNYWSRYDNLVFWGKNNSGYYSDLTKAGLYTKEEARRIADNGDCYISLDSIGITIKEMTALNNPSLEIKVKKTEKICKYVNVFMKIMNNKRDLKWGY